MKSWLFSTCVSLLPQVLPTVCNLLRGTSRPGHWPETLNGCSSRFRNDSCWCRTFARREIVSSCWDSCSSWKVPSAMLSATSTQCLYILRLRSSHQSSSSLIRRFYGCAAMKVVDFPTRPYYSGFFLPGTTLAKTFHSLMVWTTFYCDFYQTRNSTSNQLKKPIYTATLSYSASSWAAQYQHPCGQNPFSS